MQIFQRLIWDYSHSHITPQLLLFFTHLVLSQTISISRLFPADYSQNSPSFDWPLTNEQGQPSHPLNHVSNISETTIPNIKFLLLWLLSEPKYCVLFQDKGSCALKRRAGSGRWYTHWQVLMDTETTPILRFPWNYSHCLITLTWSLSVYTKTIHFPDF